MCHSPQPLTVIAGPCSAESREQLAAVVAALAAEPRVTLIRCGVWKPRTRPGGFEGMGEEALRWMTSLRADGATMHDGSPVRFCCEVALPEHVELCLRYGIGTVWIGARTTSNPFMVDELAAALRGTGTTVLVKNSPNPDLRLWVGAIERCHKAGLRGIMAVHRGFDLYNNGSYRNTPLWELPLKLRQLMPDLPLLCDPSHIGGSRRLIEPLAQMAVNLGYDGLMVEAHPDPDTALTDSRQQVTPARLAEILRALPPTERRRLDNPRIDMLRSQIDDIDHELLRLLAQRMDTSRQIAAVKSRLHQPVHQPQRWEALMDDRLRLAVELGLGTDFVKDMMETIHLESMRVQLAEEA